MTRRSRALGASRMALLLLLIPVAGTAQLAVSGTGLLTYFEHQVDIGFGVEASHGLLVGAEGVVDLRPRIAFRLHAAGGSLSTDAVGAENRDVGEIGVQASIAPTPWLALLGGMTSRMYSTAIARQHWTALDLGAEARLDFAASPMRGVLRAALLPSVSATGLPGPNLALTAAAGIEYRRAAITGGLFYGLERYDFPDEGAGRRLEQVSTLTFRLTVRRSGIIKGRTK